MMKGGQKSDPGKNHFGWSAGPTPWGGYSYVYGPAEGANEPAWGGVDGDYYYGYPGVANQKGGGGGFGAALTGDPKMPRARNAAALLQTMRKGESKGSAVWNGHEQHQQFWGLPPGTQDQDSAKWP